MADLAGFRAVLPEMAGVPDAFVEVRLAEALRSWDPEFYGSRYDDAVYQYAAHLIATSPGGLNARLASKAGESTYLDTFHRITRGCGGGPALGAT